MNVIPKSLHRSKNCKRAVKFRKMRVAKERHRIARAHYVASPEYADKLVVDAAQFRQPTALAKRSGFRVIIICHDDGERVQFDTMRGPHGLTISPTLAGKKVAIVLSRYLPV
jgi:hypothetical protein